MSLERKLILIWGSDWVCIDALRFVEDGSRSCESEVLSYLRIVWQSVTTWLKNMTKEDMEDPLKSNEVFQCTKCSHFTVKLQAFEDFKSCFVNATKHLISKRWNQHPIFTKDRELGPVSEASNIEYIRSKLRDSFGIDVQTAVSLKWLTLNSNKYMSHKSLIISGFENWEEILFWNSAIWNSGLQEGFALLWGGNT